MLIQKHKYLTLDGIRGVAAFFVLMLHMAQLTGDRYFPRAYLAVDLFFVMSGFVISAAYDMQLRSRKLMVYQFLKIRIIRLYPLYFLALLMSIILTVYYLSYEGSFEIAAFCIAIIFGLLLMPSPTFGSGIFPLNPPSWSIFFEVFANMLYAAFRPNLTSKFLVVVMVISGLSLILMSSIWSHSMNFGWGWANIIGGFPRVLYSFAAGLMVHRIRENLAFKMRFNSLIALLILSIVALLLGLPITRHTGMYDLVVVLVVFPILVLFASYVDPEPNTKLEKLFALMGLTSYAIYILQSQFLWIYSEVLLKQRNSSLLTIIASVVALYILAWLIDLFYDQPIRKMLRRKLLDRTKSI